MARYAVTAASEDGRSGEGPLYFTANSPEAARQQYLDWAATQHGDAYAGPARPPSTVPAPGPGDAAIPFPDITVDLVTV